jgi:hypothetical protein
MNCSISLTAFESPLPLLKGERIACHAVALRRREVRGSKMARELNLQILTLASPLGREG